MRTAVLIVVLVVGCAKPQPAELPAAVNVPQPAAPVEIAPAPWEVPSEPERADRYRWYQQNADALRRALARREIRAGDDVEPLIARFPECRVVRHGAWIDLGICHDFRGETGVVAKNGKLVWAGTASCYSRDEFFNTLTPEEWEGCSRSLSERTHAWSVFRDSFSAAIGLPAGLTVSSRPNDR